MIVFRRNTMFVVLTVVVCACLYDHVSARERIIKHSDLAQALMSASKAVQTNEILFTPFKIIFRFIEFLLKAVTYPFRFVYRLVFNFIAVFALLMQGCKVIPETECPGRDIQEVVDDILSGIKEELEFLATMDANA